MKLHLPCALRAALLALFVALPTVKAADITVTGASGATTQWQVEGGDTSTFTTGDNATFEKYSLTSTQYANGSFAKIEVGEALEAGDVTVYGGYNFINSGNLTMESCTLNSDITTTVTIFGTTITTDVSAGITFDGNMNVTGDATSSTSLTVDGDANLGSYTTSGSTAIGGTLTVDGAMVTTGLLSSTTVTGAADLGSLSATGFVSFEDSLTAGDVNVTGTLTVEKNAELGSLTTVLGYATLNGEDVNIDDLTLIGGKVSVTNDKELEIAGSVTAFAGSIDAAGDVDVEDSLTLAIGASLDAEGGATVGGNVLVAMGSELDTTGDLTVAGSLSAIGTSDATTDMLEYLIDNTDALSALDEYSDEIDTLVDALGDSETTITVGNDLAVDGSTTMAMGSQLEVTGSATLGAEGESNATLVSLGSSIDVTGATTVNGSLTVNGMPDLSGLLEAVEDYTTTDLSGLSDYLSDSESSASSFKTDDKLTVNGDTTVFYDSSVTAKEAELNGEVSVTNSSSLATTAGDLTVNGGLLVALDSSVATTDGDLTVNGDFTISGVPAVTDTAIDVATEIIDIVGDDAIEGMDTITTAIDTLSAFVTDGETASTATVDGNLNVTGSTTVAFGSEVSVTGDANLDSGVTVLGMPDVEISTLDGILDIAAEIAAGNATEDTVSELVSLLGVTDVDVDLYADAAALNVDGDLNVAEGDVMVALGSTVEADSITVESGDVTATALSNVTSAGDVTLKDGNLSVSALATVEVAGDLDVTGNVDVLLGTADVAGDATITGDLTTAGVGATMVDGDLTVNGNTTVVGLLQVGSAAEETAELFNEIAAELGYDITLDPDYDLNIAALEVGGTTTLNGDVNVTGATAILGDEEVTVTGDMSSNIILNGGGDLDVAGSIDSESVTLQGGTTSADSMVNSNSVVVMTGGTLDVENDANLQGLVMVAGEADFGSLSNEESAIVLSAGSELDVEGDATVGSMVVTTASAVTVDGSLTATGAVTVSGDSDTKLTAGDTQVDSLTVSDNAEVTLASLSGVFDVAVEDEGSLTLGAIQGEEGSVIQGAVTIDSTADDNYYYGTYGDGADVTLTDGTVAYFIQGEGLSLSATGSIVTIDMTAAAEDDEYVYVNSINASNSVVNFVEVDRTVFLGGYSTITGGELNVTIEQDALDAALNDGSGNGFVVTTGAALIIDGTTINVEASGYSNNVIDVAGLASDTVTIVTLSDDAGSDTTGAAVLNFGDASYVYSKYFTNVTLVGNTIVAELNRSVYEIMAQGANGSSGLDLISDALISVNPQYTAADTPDLAAVMDTMDTYMQVGTAAATTAANKTAAAVAGATISAMNSVALADINRQLDTIRERTQSRLAADPDSKMGAQAWVQAEAFTSRMENGGGYKAGYDYNSWGASVGSDVALGKYTVAGAAFTTMFGDMDSSVADVADGDFTNYYISLYAHREKGAWSHTVVGTIGMSDIDFDRTVYLNNAKYSTSGNTDGIGFGLEYEVAYTFSIDESKSSVIRPLANISYTYNHISSYTETGSDAALYVSSQSDDYITLGFGAEYEQSMGQKMFNRNAMLGARAMVNTYMGDPSTDARVNFVNNPSKSVEINSADPGIFGFEFSVGVAVPVSEKGNSVFFNAGYEVRSGNTDARATLGYRHNF